MLDALKKLGARALAHVQEHKLLYGVGAVGAGLGYLFVSSQASAKLPTLPVPKPVPAPVPNNPTLQPPVVTPAPSPGLLAHPGDVVHVTTQSTPLTARSGPGQNYAPVGSYPKGAPLAAMSEVQNGFLHVQGPGVDLKGNPLAVLEGWASASYLQQGAGNAAVDSAFLQLHNLGIL